MIQFVPSVVVAALVFNPKPRDMKRTTFVLRTVLSACVCATFFLPVKADAHKEIVDYVNPMIGASTSAEAGKSLHGLGKAFPGPATPFGLVQLSPDTKTGGDNGPGRLLCRDARRLQGAGGADVR